MSGSLRALLMQPGRGRRLFSFVVTDLVSFVGWKEGEG